MKTKVLVVAGVVVVLGIAGAMLLLSGRKPEWTTSSPQALAEFNKGLDSFQKLYYREASQHFEKAVELDPSFPSAKRFVLATMQRPSTDPEVKKLIADLEKADLSKLTARERFLISYTLADFAKDPAKAQKVLQEYAAKSPNDPFALEALANRAAAQQDWPECRRLLTRLIEVAPNRVTAYNQLGYLEMGLGQFAQSEKMFETYRYIAPDQANPRDSLGELYILIGRYDDARRELEEALRIRPDFCASYEHLVTLALMEGRPEDARAAIDRAEKAEACPAYELKPMRCQLAVWVSFFATDWQGVWQAEKTACADDSEEFPVMKLWAALRTGRTADGEAIVAKAREDVAKMKAAPSRRYAEAILAHMEGALLLAQGRPTEAAERFRFADGGLAYRELSLGRFKLINRFVLARALQAAGSGDQADAVLAEAREVNAKFLDRLGALTAPLTPN
ncbi:MAG TPA: tetratricopeptide repeat protein [Thermoanaerobaculaceae bacterium]|nr:tetratricopeptide repeat protein [Thermoanaerobaculaceae bacterium]